MSGGGMLPFARLGDCEFRADEHPVRILVVDLFGGCAQTDKVVGAHCERARNSSLVGTSGRVFGVRIVRRRSGVSTSTPSRYVSGRTF